MTNAFHVTQKLGFRVDVQGLHPTEGKLKDITEVTISQNETKAGIYLVNYYNNSIPNWQVSFTP